MKGFTYQDAVFGSDLQGSGRSNLSSLADLEALNFKGRGAEWVPGSRPLP